MSKYVITTYDYDDGSELLTEKEYLRWKKDYDKYNVTKEEITFSQHSSFTMNRQNWTTKVKKNEDGDIVFGSDGEPVLYTEKLPVALEDYDEYKSWIKFGVNHTHEIENLTPDKFSKLPYVKLTRQYVQSVYVVSFDTLEELNNFRNDFGSVKLGWHDNVETIQI